MSISLKEFMEAGGLIEANTTSDIDGGEGQPKTPHWVSKKKDGEGKRKKGKVGKGDIEVNAGGHKKPDVFDYKVVTNNTMNEEITKDDIKEIQKIIQDEVKTLTKKGLTINLEKLGKYIRREQAAMFFDLFKKRNVWMS
tara:strand:- start:462 stop:878 length:417 start_codon:yes stop_codon:yes gene_type:complete